MIFRIPKDLYAALDDASIFSAIGEFAFKIAKIKKGYFVYNRDAIQIAQIEFRPYEARITVADHGTLTLTRERRATNYDIGPLKLEKEDEQFRQFQHKIDGEYALIGSFAEMAFDVYFRAKCVMNVIPDSSDPNFFKVRINEGGNLIILTLIAIAVNKLNNDPESKL